ncbi:MAG: nucleotidyltransferase domain-containing protein [Bacteroidia bacterium]
MKLSELEIQKIKKFFIGKPVIKAYLFGSFAREQADNESDLDVLVELDYSKHIGLGFVTMQQELEQTMKRKVDLVSTNAVSKYFLPFIDKDKKLIYERKNRR